MKQIRISIIDLIKSICVVAFSLAAARFLESTQGFLAIILIATAFVVWQTYSRFTNVCRTVTVILLVIINLLNQYMYAFYFSDFMWVTDFLLIMLILTISLSTLIISLSLPSVNIKHYKKQRIIVVILIFLPICNFIRNWSLVVAFEISRPVMEQLVDQIHADHTVKYPRRVGLYVVTKADRDATNGNIALIIYSDASTRWAFVRIKKQGQDIGPMKGLNVNYHINKYWAYQVEE